MDFISVKLLAVKKQPYLTMFTYFHPDFHEARELDYIQHVE